MVLRVWCPQSVRVLPLGSVMVVVAVSAGWASHTSMGVALSVCGGVRCLYPRLALAGGCVLRRVLCRRGLMQNGLNKNSPGR